MVIFIGFGFVNIAISAFFAIWDKSNNRKPYSAIPNFIGAIIFFIAAIFVQ